MNFNALQKKEKEKLCSTYGRYPIAVQTARGHTITDFEGRKYTDLLAGISVCNVGHCHPEISRAICDQAQKLVHVSNLFYQQEQLQLADELLDTCGLDKVFFCNSGAEANEGAIKAARIFMHKIMGLDRHEIITLKNSFHGRTMATLSATGQKKIKDGFSPLLPGFKHVEANNKNELLQTYNENTAAIMVEVIQGEGGIVALNPDYLDCIQKLCTQENILLIIDEVQTGMGRTGKFWAHQYFDLQPDIVTCAKALANGLPMGAVMFRQNVARAFGPGSHATTFGGSPLVCAAALKTLEIIKRENLVEQSAKTGEYARKLFTELQEKNSDKIEEIRGIGLMLGIKLTFPGQQVWKELLDRGFILNLTQEKVLRLLPPLNIPRDQLDLFAGALEEVITNCKICG
ncbi:MAG: aspartate aminotransferase family protein [Thermodesulfobacteriota bacterium]